MSALGRLAVDDRHRRARLAPGPLAHLDVKHVMNSFGGALPFRAGEVVLYGTLGRQVLQQCLPLAAGGEDVEDGVQHFAQDTLGARVNQNTKVGLGFIAKLKGRSSFPAQST